ncbi:MAG: molybdopterin cofactor-binding domain-containing protein [Bryobacterales bacterium]
MTTTQAAMADGAPVIHDDLHMMELGEKTDKVGNVAEHFRHEKGDIDAGFAQADVVVEREFDTATVHQGYIEPQNATALWNNDERLEIWTSTQGAFPTRDVTATVLDLPVSQVKVKPMEIGGGFGGKIPVYLEPVAALLSRRADGPSSW